MMRIIQNKWIAVAIGALTYALTTWFALHPQKLVAHLAAEARSKSAPEKAAAPPAPSWNFDNPEMTSLMAELKQQREALRTRALQLDELESRLNAERRELFTVTQDVARLRTNLEATLTHISEEEGANLKKVVKMYAGMSPEGAVRGLRQMEDDQLVKLLAVMRESERTPILEALQQGTPEDARRATLLVDRLRRMVLDNPKSKKPTAL